MSVRRIKTNSAVEVADVALWLPLIVEAIKGLKLQVKTEGKVVYISLGTTSQLAIYPESESKGKFEKQEKENNVVKVVEEGNYDSLKNLVELVTKATSTNSSKQSSNASKNSNSTGARRILRAGKNHQKSIRATKLNSSRKNIPMYSKAASIKTNANKKQRKLQRLQSSATSVNNPAEVIGAYTDDLQPVQGVLFNVDCPETNEPTLYIAYYDEITDVWVVQRITIPGDCQVFNDKESMIQTMFPPAGTIQAPLPIDSPIPARADEFLIEEEF